MKADRWEIRDGKTVKDPNGGFFFVPDVFAALEEHQQTNIAPRKRDRALYKRLRFRKGGK